MRPPRQRGWHRPNPRISQWVSLPQTLPGHTGRRPPPPMEGGDGVRSALRRLDEHQLPPVQHLGDRTSLLDLPIRVPNGVMQGLDMDARNLHDYLIPQNDPRPTRSGGIMAPESSRGRSVVVA